MTNLLNRLGMLPARWISLLLLTIYLFTYAGVTHSIDELATLTVTESLLFEQQWRTNQMAWDQARTPPQNAPGVDGNLYSKKGIGIALAALPLFALNRLWPHLGAIQLALLTNAFLTAIMVYLFYRVVITFNFSTTTAALGALALGLATPLWPYARTLFSEPLAALGLCLALLGVFQYRRQAAPANKWAAMRPLLWASCGLALLVLARSANAILIPPFLAYLLRTARLQRTTQPRRVLTYQAVIALGLPLGGAVLATLLYNYTRFHTWLTFPQASFETFSTPLLTGLTGLLVSPGKGFLWYMPVMLLLFWGLSTWRATGHFDEYALAATLFLLTLLFYAKWYDWTGGRTWGPRLLVMTTPALLLLCLPALDRLRTRQGVARWWMSGCLLLSILVQLPGVLLNFEWLEAAQMKAGVTFAQLVWSPRHAPLWTYWRAFFDSAWLDPAWWQPTFRQQPWPFTAGFVLVGITLVIVWVVGSRRARHQQPERNWWVVGVCLALLFALLTVYLAAADPRWQESSANPTANQAVLDYLRMSKAVGDVVVLDMTTATDQQGRQRFWMNRGAGALPYIAWARNSGVLSLDEQLARWLIPYKRIWLVMQETVEDDPNATTERWLDQHGYRGRQLWLGSQRIVEYIAATQRPPLPSATTPSAFGDAAVLTGYTLRPGGRADYLLLDLTWQSRPAAEWRFSVQALNSSGQVVAQLDDRPARLPGYRDQIGVTLPTDAQQVILKIYHSQSGQVAPVAGPNGPTELIPLLTLQ
ncbi:MAG: hypothetical protein DYG89_39120 [Caldilinea sp. CFX5]|nr:hypothetical protein [Caldilinea sp. CFX5]